MKKILSIFIFVFFVTMFSGAQQNDFFMKLYDKEMATFNDAITLMRLLFNERDDNCIFIDNILWAAEKKLFKVTIPISTDQVNPLISRREFAYWICKIFNNKKGIVNVRRVYRYNAFKVCVTKGLMSEGRGPFDSFSGAELLETFAYLDYYVRHNKIVPKMGKLEIYDDTYKNLPEWREKLHKEFEEQKEREKELREERRKQRKEERKKKMQLNKKSDHETYIEKRIEE